MNIELDILDSLADDFESIEQIKNFLTNIGYTITNNEINKVLQNMLNDELIYINEIISDKEYTWYGMTQKGKEIWDNTEWNPKDGWIVSTGDS